jgi:hypothetical protein
VPVRHVAATDAQFSRENRTPRPRRTLAAADCQFIGLPQVSSHFR